jgi:arylsulfatase A-like enzyme
VAKGKLCQRPVSLIDVYPTLIDLCDLPKRKGLDGQSLKPLLENPGRKWERPVVITYGMNNHAVQTERWRYIRYRDGGQELYDHDRDSNEWTNLASIPEYSSVKSKLANWLPTAKVGREKQRR